MTIAGVVEQRPGDDGERELVEASTSMPVTKGLQPAALPIADDNSASDAPYADRCLEAGGVAQRAGEALLKVLMWVPPGCRYDPVNPPAFTLGLNCLFSFATTATVANLYYNQSILYKMADTFDVSYERASHIASLMQAGYATGLVLLVPLADVLQRRPFILALVALTALLWIGLCVTNSFSVFTGISYMVGFTTVTPQLMFPLVGELAPPERRAGALAIVVSGLSLGMMVARLLAGVVSNYTSWRNVYWVSLGLQAMVFASLFLFMPDYPTKNTLVAEVEDGDEGGDGAGELSVMARLRRVVRRAGRYAVLLYGGILLAVVRHPALAQACLIIFCLSAVFTNYWTTLSFLLASPPYEYASTTIGLFGLIGIVIICAAPYYGRAVLQRLSSMSAVLMSNIIELAGVALGFGLGPFSVAGPVLQAILVDFGNQGSNVALRMSIFGLDPKAQNRINSAYMVMSFSGQLTGTSAGNRLYAMGGWRYSCGLSLGLLGFATIVCLARGPRETGWIGWHGGWELLREKEGARKTTEGAADSSSGEDGAAAVAGVGVGSNGHEVRGDEKV